MEIYKNALPELSKHCLVLYGVAKKKKKEKVKNFQNLLNVQECFDKFSTPLNAVQQQH